MYSSISSHGLHQRKDSLSRLISATALQHASSWFRPTDTGWNGEISFSRIRARVRLGVGWGLMGVGYRGKDKSGWEMQGSEVVTMDFWNCHIQREEMSQAHRIILANSKKDLPTANQWKKYSKAFQGIYHLKCAMNLGQCSINILIKSCHYRANHIKEINISRIYTCISRISRKYGISMK